MAKDKVYSSILDSFLDMEDREPDWKNLGLADAKSSGEAVLKRTHDEADEEDALDFLGKKTSGVNQSASTHLAASPEDYKNAIGDDDSLLSEVTMSLDSAEKGATVEKKSISDGEVQRWIKQLLNEGHAPAKIAAKLNKLAEIQLFNKTMATDYLNSHAGLLGLAYIEPNQYMDSCPSTYQRLGINGIKAKSAKQVKACSDCQHFKQNGNSKHCALYKLPLVANEKELSGVVNKMTAGVPKASKKAALVQIANGTGEKVTPTVISRMAGEGYAEGQEKRASSRADVSHAEQTLDGKLIQKMHAAGHDLKKIAKAARDKFGDIETSRAIREFVASLKRTDEGNIVLAKADANFLKALGIHKNIVGAEKCLSCATHIAHKEHKQASKTDMVSRVTEHQFQERTLDQVRASQAPRKVAKFDKTTVEKLHNAGNSLEKIYRVASEKVGTQTARKAVTDFVANLKNTNTKVALSQIDCQFLKNKLGAQNVIVGADKCASCTYRQGMHCGLTGGTLLSYPGMDKADSNKKVAANAPKDGYAMLNEYDLAGSAQQQDIEMSAPDRADVEMNNTMTAGEIE